MKRNLHVFFLLSSIALTASGQNPDDEQIRKMARSMEDAWATKNSESFSNHFCADHDYIVWNGMYSPGITVEANKNGHEVLFTELEEKNTQVKYVVDKIFYLSEAVALVNILGSVYHQDSDPLPYPTQIQTWVLINEGERWKIKSMHSTDIEYDIFIHQDTCPEIPSTEEQKIDYAREFYKSYYATLNH